MEGIYQFVLKAMHPQSLITMKKQADGWMDRLPQTTHLVKWGTKHNCTDQQ